MSPRIVSEAAIWFPEPDADCHHGLTKRAAEVVLFSNGPSKITFDATDLAFKEAVSMHNRQLQCDQRVHTV